MAKTKPDRVVNLDALLRRDDFFEETDLQSDTNEIRITDLEPGMTFSRLRKPDFQRETANWTPEQIIDLIETFCADEIIPAVILWESGPRIFVVDGAHRLSALIGWIQSDFGAGPLSRSLYGAAITPHQQRMHDATMSLLKSGVGLWDNYKSTRPQWSMKTLQIQWIKGRTAAQAAKAFIRINRGGTEIDDLEVRILSAARSALSIASRAVVRGGSGHEYWKHFSDQNASDTTPKIGSEIYKLLYKPTLEVPLKTVELPLAGAPEGHNGLRLAFDLIALSNGLSVPDSSRSRVVSDPMPDDADGTETVNFLRRTRKVVQLILSNQPHSFGLHPALWFYNAKGAFQPAALLNVAAWLLDLEKTSRLGLFRKHRGRLEEIILEHPSLIKPATNKLGSGGRTRKRMIGVLDRALVLLGEGKPNNDVWAILASENKALGRDDEEQREEALKGTAGGAFSMPVKNAASLLDLPLAPRCRLCGGLLHPNGKTLDHVEKKADNGSSALINSRYVHPVCGSERDKDEKGKAAA